MKGEERGGGGGGEREKKSRKRRDLPRVLFPSSFLPFQRRIFQHSQEKPCTREDHRSSHSTHGRAHTHRRVHPPHRRSKTCAAVCAARAGRIGIFRKCIFRKFCKFLAGSFSAASKRNFARKYAFDSIFQALQDLHPFAPLQSQNFRKKSV